MAGIVSSIWGGIRGSHAVGNAANVLAGTSDEVAQRIQDAISQALQFGQAGLGAAEGVARGGLNQYNQNIDWGLNKANPLLADFYNQGVSALSPYLAAGGQGINQLAQFMGPGGRGSTPFNASMMESQDPGYQFRLQQGARALQMGAAARGGVLGGAQQKALSRYGQDYASNEYQNAWNRYMQGNQQTFNMLNALANYGQGATNEYLNLGQTTAGRIAGNLMGAGQAKAGAALSVGQQLAPMELSGNEWLGTTGLAGENTVGNYLMQGADATAAGQLGQANAFSGMIGGIANGINGIAGGYFMGGIPGAIGGATGLPIGGTGGYFGTPPFLPPGSSTTGFGGYGGFPTQLTPAQLDTITGAPSIPTPPAIGTIGANYWNVPGFGGTPTP